MFLKASTRKTKKLMAIFEDGTRVHFGGKGCADYTVYFKKYGKACADRKRATYIARHGATESWDDPKTAATLSRYILWEYPTIAQAAAKYARRCGVRKKS